MKSLLFLLLFLVPTLAIVIKNGGHSRRRFHSSSSSWSSSDESSHHHHHHPKPRPPRPPRPNPPTPPPTECPSGWMVFDRPQGKWCVQIFPQHTLHNEAEALCQAKGATLTGLQTNDERLRLAAEGRRLAQLSGYAEAATWLGAHRRAACPFAASCNSQLAFEWTDGHTTGTAGFGWGNGEPNGFVRNGVVQDCVFQLIYPYSDTGSFLPTIHHGLLDDQYCVAAVNPRDPIRKMYACGRTP